MTSALGAGQFTRYGKWNMILATNVLVLLAVAICMVNNSIVILFGRFVYGMAAGAFTVFVPKYTSELAPSEYRGPFGAVNQFMCTLGILACSLLGLAIPSKAGEVAALDENSFIVQQYWRVVWGLPAVFLLIQITLMLTVFKYETPVTYKQRADYDKMSELFSKIYIKEQIKMRMDEVQIQQESDHTDEDGNSSLKVSQPSTRDTFCDPNIRRAAWVGCALSIFQQLSGINAIIFYSSTIFASTGSTLAPNTQTALVMAVNCAAVVGSSFMLNFAGRKSLMFLWTAMCGVFLFVQGAATISGWGTIELVMTMAFVAAFEFAPGPIVWLYMGEILNDKGISVAVFLNWLFTLVIGLITPFLLKPSVLGGGTFIMFGVFNILSCIFIALFMKETKGLSDEQVKYLYRKDRDVIKEFEKQ